jgi:superfamily II DNA or RNA helicase
MNPQTILAKSKNWKSFKAYLKPLSTKQKGDAFELLTKHYLQLHPTYMTQLQNVWLLGEVETKVRKKLNLPATDEGIDLIAETKDGAYWAIQCKYKEDETKSLTRTELSTFTDLAFGIGQNIELGLVCTSTDKTSHKLKMHGDRLNFCSGEVWRSLDEEFFKRLHKHIKKKAAPLAPLKPRAHQKRAVTKAHRHFVEENNSRGKLIMPCGTGKSLAGYWIAEKLESNKILVAVPSLALIKQTLEVWARESVANKQTMSWICVCSDESVSDIEKDDIAIFVQDLGIKIHTDPKVIAQWLKKKHAGKTIVFTTYQSGKAIAQAARKSKTTFDLAIMDEAHKTVGKADSVFSHLLYDKNIKIDHRIFMTATERRYQGKSDQILSMEDPKIYGDTFEMLSFKEALDAKPPLLSDYKIVTIFISRDEIKDLVAKNLFVKPDKGKWDKEVEAEMLASLIALRKAMEKYPIKKAVSFHSSIARAKSFSASQDVFTKSFREYGELDTFHVTGKLPTSARAKVVQEFTEASRSLITNARCLTEGVDVPNIDCILFADPKRSTVDIVQAVGRALRPHKDKEYGYVIIPVLIDKEVNDGEEIDKEVFGAILTTLRALAADDERIVEYFRSVSQGRQRGKGDSPFEIDLPDGIKIDVEEFVESVELKLWDRLAKLSWRSYREAREFARSLNLKTVKEWQEYCVGKLTDKPLKPADIPTIPPRTYKDKDWDTWGDWLGADSTATRDRRYRTFEEAKIFIHTLGLNTQAEWKQYCQGKMADKGQLPVDIPKKPDHVYKEDWISAKDWLGTQRVFRSFEKARKFVRSLNLKNVKQWELYCQKKIPDKGVLPIDIPPSPSSFYKGKGWVNWGDWLGTGTIAYKYKNHKPFVEARKFARALCLKSNAEWVSYCEGKVNGKPEMPDNIPKYPRDIYQDEGWVGMGDWLGTGRVQYGQIDYRSHEEAKSFVHTLNLKSEYEWRDYCKGKIKDKQKKPENIPATPGNKYKHTGWLGFGDWLGTGNISPRLKQYRPFKEAREFVRTLMLKTGSEWVAFAKSDELPDDIPLTPRHVYRNTGWEGIADWLGTENKKKSK